MALGIAASVSGRDLSGLVVGENGQGLPYPTVKIKNRSIGVLGDSAGRFTLPMERVRNADTLTISYLGYSAAEIPVRELSADTLNYCMTPTKTGLRELTVAPSRRVKRKAKGKQHNSGISRCFLGGQTAGDTYGYEFHAKKNRRLVLDRVGFLYCEGDSQMTHMKFRLNIYDMNGEKKSPARNFVNILSRPIIFEFNSGESRQGRFEYVLPEQIVLPLDAMVEIEFLENLGSEKLWYKCNLLGKRTWYKEVTDNYWERCPLATPFFVEVLEMDGSR